MAHDASKRRPPVARRPARTAAELARRIVPLVYDDLRARARRFLRDERTRHTLSPTALVHEAYDRLAHGPLPPECGRTEFVAIAAAVMRRVLVDHARARAAAKRGARRPPVRLATGQDAGAPSGVETLDVLALDEALQQLETLNGRHARVIELRFYAGMTVPEVATTLGVSVTTVESDWRMARAWLARALDARSS
jgi:RNA polymerase sigma factor (TIGR02999 family)